MRENVLAIVEEVAAKHGLTASDLLSRDRHKSVARARGIAMWSARTQLGLSYPELGAQFGRDHTTCMSYVRKVERYLAGA